MSYIMILFISSKAENATLVITVACNRLIICCNRAQIIDGEAPVCWTLLKYCLNELPCTFFVHLSGICDFRFHVVIPSASHQNNSKIWTYFNEIFRKCWWRAKAEINTFWGFSRSWEDCDLWSFLGSATSAGTPAAPTWTCTRLSVHSFYPLCIGKPRC